MAKVAVVILNYNGEEMLRRFLPSVVEHSGDAEIVVADNASGDASVNLLEKDFPGVRIIRLKRNYGFADGYNKALEQVCADYLVLLNSDVEVTPGWLEPLVGFMDRTPAAAACQPKLLDYKRKECFEYAGASGGFIDRYGYPYCRGRIFENLESDQGQYDDVCQVFWATGAAFMVRSEAYKAAGGLDGRFFAHMEEIDLCWRLQTRCGGVYAVPQSKVYHVGGATLDKSNPKKTYLNFRNNLLMLYKNLPASELSGVMRMRCILDYVAAAKFLLAGGWGDFKAVLKARRDYKRMRGSYDAVRSENLAKSQHAVKGKAAYSILWQYYLKGKKRFTQLDKF